MRTRRTLTEDMTTKDAILELGDGQPGGLNVLCALLISVPHDAYVRLLHDLDDMNLRGNQILRAWRDVCRCDLDTFRDMVTTRNPALVRLVNLRRSFGEEVAVPSGGKFR